jgi:N-acetylneuraminate synthase
MTIVIGGRIVGPTAPSFVIAEAGVNHNGDAALAAGLVDVAADAGADAIKFQTFRARQLASPSAAKAAYQQRTTDPHESQLAMLERLELGPGHHQALLARCRERGILFLSSAFEEESADLLEQLGVAAFKIPSGEITNLPFLAHVARKGRPVIMSTGMATLDEVRTAVGQIRAAGDPPLALLHCVSNYPADPATSNLRAMPTLAQEFGVPVGFSDHTEGIDIALAAVAVGACIIEKHFTLDRRLPGPDHRASLEPAELAQLVAGIRRVESALGDGRKAPVPSEEPVARVARKSVIATMDIPAGAMLSRDMVAIRRPGTGLPPSALGAVIGGRARIAIAAGTPITAEMLL